MVRLSGHASRGLASLDIAKAKVPAFNSRRKNWILVSEKTPKKEPRPIHRVPEGMVCSGRTSGGVDDWLRGAD